MMSDLSTYCDDCINVLSACQGIVRADAGVRRQDVRANTALDSVAADVSQPGAVGGRARALSVRRQRREAGSYLRLAGLRGLRLEERPEVGLGNAAEGPSAY